MSASQEILNYLPEIATAAGYAAGQVGEFVVRHTVQRNRDAALGAHEGIEGDSGRQPFLRRSLALLAVTAALAGGATGEAIAPTHTSEVNPNTIVPNTIVATVADHSFGTGQDGSLSLINSVSEAINSSSHVQTETLLAHNGTHDLATDGKQIKNDTPYGPPTAVASAVPEAITLAFARSKTVKTNGLQKSSAHNAGVLVITDGNSAGNASVIVNQAKTEGNIPIFVADTGSANGSNTESLRQIAKETGGKYWHVTKENVGSVAVDVKSDITPGQTPEKQPPNRLPWIATAAALWGLTGLEFLRRRQKTAITDNESLSKVR